MQIRIRRKLGRLAVRDDGRLTHKGHDPVMAVVGVCWQGSADTGDLRIVYRVTEIEDGEPIPTEFCPTEG